MDLSASIPRHSRLNSFMMVSIFERAPGGRIPGLGMSLVPRDPR
jgi:hypothetical protein